MSVVDLAEARLCSRLAVMVETAVRAMDRGRCEFKWGRLSEERRNLLFRDAMRLILCVRELLTIFEAHQ